MDEKNKKPLSQNEVKRYSTFFIESTRIGVDIGLVQEINESSVVTAVPLAKDYIKGIMNLRGQIITIIDLHTKLGFESSKKEEKQNGVVIVTWRNENIGLLVDSVGDVIEAPVNVIEPPPSNIQETNGNYFRGVIYTASSEILALLDIDALLEEED